MLRDLSVSVDIVTVHFFSSPFLSIQKKNKSQLWLMLPRIVAVAVML
jgi:hypothetical protein